MRSQFFRPFRVPLSPSDWLVLSAALIVLVVGCFWLLSALSLAFTNEVPARGGTYKEAVIGTPRFVNPVLAVSEVDRDLTQLVFSGLMRATTDGELVPDLAESVQVSDDTTTYTFVLREQARFHDGTPVTAADIEYTVGLAQNSLVKSPKRASWEGVLVTVIDDRTVSFTLNEPYALFLENARLGILPKHLWENVSPDEISFSKLNSEPVGSGPFEFENLVTTSGGIPSLVTLRGVTDGVRVPYIEVLEFHFFGDTESQQSALLSDPMLAAHSVLPEGRTPHEAVLGRIFAVFFNQNQQTSLQIKRYARR